MTALDELVSEHPWWDLAELILWVGTRDFIAWHAHLSDEKRWEKGLDKLRKRCPDDLLLFEWSHQVECAVRAGKLEITYIDGVPRKVEAHELAYLRIGGWHEIGKEPCVVTLHSGPYLYWDAGRLYNARIKAADIVAAFPMETPAIAAPKVGPDGGRPSSMYAIEVELDRWIAGGIKLVLERMQRYAPRGLAPKVVWRSRSRIGTTAAQRQLRSKRRCPRSSIKRSR
jgi:hypothetical protein